MKSNGEMSFFDHCRAVYRECRWYMRRGRMVSGWHTLRYVVLGDSGKIRQSPATSRYVRMRHAEWWSFQKLGGGG